MSTGRSRSSFRCADAARSLSSCAGLARRHRLGDPVMAPTSAGGVIALPRERSSRPRPTFMSGRASPRGRQRSPYARKVRISAPVRASTVVPGLEMREFHARDESRWRQRDALAAIKAGARSVREMRSPLLASAHERRSVVAASESSRGLSEAQHDQIAAPFLSWGTAGGCACAGGRARLRLLNSDLAVVGSDTVPVAPSIVDLANRLS
jgi:hypothetical protein